MKTGFDAHIDHAAAKYADDTYANVEWKNVAKRLRAERRIAGKLITACLRANMLVSVNDGEETVVTKSTNKAEIMAALASTDADVITIYNGSQSKAFIGSVAIPGKRVGAFYLIYGNADDGSELISDYTDTPVCQGIYSTVYPEA